MCKQHTCKLDKNYLYKVRCTEIDYIEFKIKMIDLKLFISAITSTIAVTAIISSQQHNLSNYSQLQNDSYEQASEAERVRLNLISKIPSFGYDNLLADWSVLQFLQYLGNYEAREKTGFALLPKFLEIIVEKDPLFTEAQFMISPMVSLKAGKPEETVSLLNKSLAKLSPIIYGEDNDKIHKPNFLWIYKAIDEILFLGDTKLAQQSYTKAAEWSKLLGDSTRANSALQAVKFLNDDPNSKVVQVGAWFTVWTSTSDAEIRLLAQRNIERLGGKLEIHEDGRVFAHPPQEKES